MINHKIDHRIDPSSGLMILGTQSDWQPELLKKEKHMQENALTYNDLIIGCIMGGMALLELEKTLSVRVADVNALVTNSELAETKKEIEILVNNIFTHRDTGERLREVSEYYNATKGD